MPINGHTYPYPDRKVNEFIRKVTLKGSGAGPSDPLASYGPVHAQIIEALPSEVYRVF
jgi:hypothetical protein